MKIYKIIKPGTNEVYIGQTKKTLKERLRNHFNEQQRKPHIEVYQWLDETCIIELLEEFESDKKDLVKEMKWVQEYLTKGFCIKNTRVGKYILDPESYIKANNDNKSATYHALYKANGKQKEWNDNRHPNYVNWQNRIARAAKKEGLSSKEYRLKYSITDYLGSKKN